MRATQPGRTGRSLQAVQRRFEQWRCTRVGGRRIPEELWAAAIEQTRDHSFNQVAQVLHLNPTELKRRSESRGPERSLARGPSRFVELKMADSITESGQGRVVVELEDGTGRRIRIALDGSDRTDVLDWAGRMWSGRWL